MHRKCLWCTRLVALLCLEGRVVNRARLFARISVLALAMGVSVHSFVTAVEFGTSFDVYGGGIIPGGSVCGGEPPPPFLLFTSRIKENHLKTN